MYKLIRSIAPVVLVLFFCAAVLGPAFGEDTIKTNDNPDISCSIQYKDGLPQINKEFKIVVKASYKGEALLNLQPINNGAFEAINISNESSDGGQVFQLKAPSKPGTYSCSFEGMTSDSNFLMFSIPIKVYSEKASSPNWGFIACVVTGAVIMGSFSYALGDLVGGKEFFGLGGILFGGLIGGLLGTLFFPNPKEDIK